MLQMLNFDDPNQNPLNNHPQPEMNLNYRSIKPPQTANNFYKQNIQSHSNNPNIQNSHENHLGKINLPRVKSNFKRINLNVSSDNLDNEGFEMNNDDGMQPKVYDLSLSFLIFL